MISRRQQELAEPATTNVKVKGSWCRSLEDVITTWCRHCLNVHLVQSAPTEKIWNDEADVLKGQFSFTVSGDCGS